MKNILVLTAALALATTASAAIISVTAVLTPDVSTVLFPGNAYGTFDSSTSLFTIAGSLVEPLTSPVPTSATISGPSSYNYIFPTFSTSPLGGFELTGFASGIPKPSGPTGFPSGYYVNIWSGSTKLASGPIMFGAVVPEPETYTLAVGTALLGLAAFRVSRR